MIHYRCNYCEAGFDEPITVTYKEHIGENMTRLYKEERCPICGCDNFREVDICQKCGDPTEEQGDILCKRCKRILKKKIIGFFDLLTATEEEQFDAWMDGESITNRRAWK